MKCQYILYANYDDNKKDISTFTHERDVIDEERLLTRLCFKRVLKAHPSLKLTRHRDPTDNTIFFDVYDTKHGRYYAEPILGYKKVPMDDKSRTEDLITNLF